MHKQFLTRPLLKNILIFSFFGILILIGTSIYKDYGISWDEPEQRLSGLVSMKYIGEYFDVAQIKKSEALAEYHQFNLESYRDRAFGVAFEMPLVALERVFHLSDERDIYFFRHYVNFLVFILGAYAVFKLSERRFESWRIGLLTTAFLILTPRLFAESFYNSKDLVFLAFFAIATNTAIIFVLQPSLKNAFWHGLATGVAMDVRLMAIILPVYTVILLLLRSVRNEQNVREALAFGFLYFIFSALCVVAFWPWLWSAPGTNFLEALLSFTRWVRSDVYMLYDGMIIRSLTLPWHYLPTWISITTPPLYLFLGLIGMGSIIIKIRLKKLLLWKGNKEFQDIFFLGLFLGPILAVIFLHSVIYDGWRHLYFIYPAFLVIATKGWLEIWNFFQFNAWKKNIFILVTLGSMGTTAHWMWTSHPYQNVYFNFLVGSGWKDKYDLDYWGLSNRRALELILNQDSRPLIKVRAGSNTPLYHALKGLSPNDRKRFEVITDENKADYIVLNFRGKTVDDQLLANNFHLQSRIMVSDELILEIWRRNTAR